MEFDEDSNVYIENYNDVLSEGPSDIENNDEENVDNSDSGSDIRVRTGPRIMHLSSDSEDGSESDEEMDWTDTDTPRNNPSFCGTPGVKIFPKNSGNVADTADMFISNDIFEHIVKETNRYYEQNTAKFKEPKKTPKWVNVTVQELRLFFGLIIIMGQVRKNTIKDYWSKNPLIETPIFSRTMKRNRFMQILTFLHFNDNTKITKNSDRLVKVQYLIDYFQNKFQSIYKPKQNLALDEAMIPWKGRLLFKTYNPSKIIKYGILCRMVCESATAYIANFKIYSGVYSKLEDTVKYLLAPFKGLWHHIYMDNFYNSLSLALKLIKDKFRMCGTIRLNRGLSYLLKTVKLAPSETKFQRKDEALVQVWKQKKSKANVKMISTIHNSDMKTTSKKDRISGEFIKKPSCVIDYNSNMKGVDRADQYLAFYSIMRKTRKWTKKVAFYLFNCALFNSFVVFNELNSTKKIRYQSFLLSVANSWITSDFQTPQSGPSTSTTGYAHFDCPGRLSGNLQDHKLIKIISDKTKKMVRRACKVCSKKNKGSKSDKSKRRAKDSSFMCKFCKVPLHRGECFDNYHTKKNY